MSAPVGNVGRWTVGKVRAENGGHGCRRMCCWDGMDASMIAIGTRADTTKGNYFRAGPGYCFRNATRQGFNAIIRCVIAIMVRVNRVVVRHPAIERVAIAQILESRQNFCGSPSSQVAPVTQTGASSRLGVGLPITLVLSRFFAGSLRCGSSPFSPKWF